MQEQLGYSRIATTMDTYGHLIPALSQEVADTMDTVLAKGKVKAEIAVASSVASKQQPPRLQ